MSEDENRPRPFVSGRDAPRPLPRKFYTVVSTELTDDGHAILLDGRRARTPLKRPLAVPVADLAHAIADEWRAQADNIDPATMPLTKLATTAIDAVRGEEARVASEIVAYAGSDLVCYRADAPERLVALQAAHWDPILAFAQKELGAEFRRVTGLMPVAQPIAATTAVARAIADLDALAIASLHVMTTLSGSALIALAHAFGHLTADEAWTAAHIDEDWQIARWGEDSEAAERRQRRRREFAAASRTFAAVTTA